jgi:class 3 adenylate cyclase
LQHRSRFDANIEGERKTVTMLFADIKGSMDLIEELDPEEARAIVDPALKLMIKTVQHYGGYVAKSAGDVGGCTALCGRRPVDEARYAATSLVDSSPLCVTHHSIHREVW